MTPYLIVLCVLVYIVIGAMVHGFVLVKLDADPSPRKRGELTNQWAAAFWAMFWPALAVIGVVFALICALEFMSKIGRRIGGS